MYSIYYLITQFVRYLLNNVRRYRIVCIGKLFLQVTVLANNMADLSYGFILFYTTNVAFSLLFWQSAAYKTKRKTNKTTEKLFSYLLSFIFTITLLCRFRTFYCSRGFIFVCTNVFLYVLKVIFLEFCLYLHYSIKTNNTYIYVTPIKPEKM